MQPDRFDDLAPSTEQARFHQNQAPAHAACAHHAPPHPDLRGGFDSLVAPHLEHLHKVGESILGSPDLACDAVQAALLTLWRRNDAPPQPRGWLVRAVVHHALHLLRHERRRRVHEQASMAERAEACPVCDPAFEVEARGEEAWLRARIEALPDDLRETCRLRGEELDYEDIAARLYVPVGTVRSRLHRARAVLAEELQRRVS